MPTNLYDFYKGKLPSLQQRGQLYQQYGLGNAASYTGLAPQNTALLNSLLQQGKPAVPPVQGVKQVGQGAAINQTPYTPTTPQAPTQPATTVPKNAPLLAQASTAFTPSTNPQYGTPANIPTQDSSNPKGEWYRENTPDGRTRVHFNDNTYQDIQPQAQQPQLPQTPAVDPTQQKFQNAILASLERLTNLKNEMLKAGAPSQLMQQLDIQEQELSQRFADLQDPYRVMRDNPTLANVGITLGGLEGRINEQISPLQRSLSTLLLNRSVLGREQQQRITNAQTNLGMEQNQLELIQALRELSMPKTIGTQFDEATGSWNQLIQSPSGGLTTRTTSLPEVGKGLNAYEYKQVVDLAKQNPGAGIKVGQPATTDSFQTALAKVAATGGGGKLETQVVDVDGQKILINSNTGETIKNLTGTPGNLNQTKVQLNGDVFVPNKTLTGEEKEKTNTVLGARLLIDQAETLYKDAIGNEYTGIGSGVIARVKGLGRIAGSVVGTNQKWQVYQNFIDSNKAIIAKGLKGQTGNLNVQEQNDAIKSFPGRFSSPFEADKAFATIREQTANHLSVLGTLTNTQIGQGEIKVKSKIDGQIGSIPGSMFDTKLFIKL